MHSHWVVVRRRSNGHERAAVNVRQVEHVAA